MYASAGTIKTCIRCKRSLGSMPCDGHYKNLHQMQVFSWQVDSSLARGAWAATCNEFDDFHCRLHLMQVFIVPFAPGYECPRAITSREFISSCI